MAARHSQHGCAAARLRRARSELHPNHARWQRSRRGLLLKRDELADERQIPPAATGLRFWFHDGNDGQWIDGKAATFVASPEFRTPMGGGMMAYRDRAAATQAAGRYRGEVIGALPQLLTRKGGQS